MISSRREYLEYLEADKKALYFKTKRPRLLGDHVWKFQRILRRYEYHLNCSKSFFLKPLVLFLKIQHYYASLRLGFTIPPNIFGPGLSVAHYGFIIVNAKARVGSNCRIHSGVTIGAKDGLAPTLGDNVYIGPGVVIYGNIRIANGVVIGANSVVGKTIDQENCTIAGAPARVISDTRPASLTLK